jgi:hypothetical protein
MQRTSRCECDGYFDLQTGLRVPPLPTLVSANPSQPRSREEQRNRRTGAQVSLTSPLERVVAGSSPAQGSTPGSSTGRAPNVRFAVLISARH